MKAGFKKLSLVISLLFLTGCSLWKEVYSEFSAYFNTYYNARTLFRDVENEIKRNKNAEKFLTIENFEADVKISPTSNQKLDDVIKKCSKILQYYLNASIADDALLMIGKAYLYQGNYTSSERKFAELISTFPKSKLYDEAIYLLALSMVKQKKYDNAILAIQTRANLERKPKKANLFKIYAYAKYKIGEIDSSLYYLRIAYELAKGEERAMVSSYIAEILEKINLQESAKYFLEASKKFENSNFKTFSLIKYAIVQRQLKNFDIAERVLNDLIFSQSDSDYLRRIYLELARTYRDAGKIDKAIATYTYLDTTFSKTNESAYGFYELGEIYETKVGDYGLAQTFYERARGEYPQSDVSKQAVKKSEQFNFYFKYRSTISRNDSILKLIAENDSLKNKFNADSIKNIIAGTKYSLALLFYNSFNRLDSAIFYLNDIIDNYPSSNALPQSLYLLATVYAGIDSAKSREIYLKLIDMFPESEFSNHARKLLGIADEIKSDTLPDAYERAIAIIDLNPDSALKILLTLCNHGNPSLKVKAYCAIAWIYEYKFKDFKKASEYYNEVIQKFPNSEYAKIIQRKLNPEQPKFEPTESIKAPASEEPEKAINKTSDNEDVKFPKERDRRRRRIDEKPDNP